MSTIFKELNKFDDIGLIKNVQYSIFPPDMIRNGAVCEVKHQVLYESGEPKYGGIMDPRMGVLDYGKICPTCENKSDLCPGHFGYIDLAKPVFLYHNVQNKSLNIIKLLRCFCCRCSALLIDKTDITILNEIKNKTGFARFKIIYALIQKIATKNKICKYNNGCGKLQPKFEKNVNKNDIIQIIGTLDYEGIDQNDKMTIYSAELCYKILSRITDEDCMFIGLNPKFTRPEWLVTTVLPVPPPAVRPSVKQGNNVRSEDDLSYILQNIVRYNNDLKKYMLKNEDQSILDKYYKILQFHVATLIDNEITGLNQNAQRSKRPLKAIRERISAKEGRVRGNIMGKRVDFTARTVITADPYISIEEFGVPKLIAMNLTVPEVVTKVNIDKLYELVRNGPDKYPGAKTIQKMKNDCNGVESPCIISLKYVDVNSVVLHEGDVVERHLQNGDIGFFNRQPSLHRMSMMAHKIRIFNGKTFRINLSNTTPYNADCDGELISAF